MKRLGLGLVLGLAASAVAHAHDLRTAVTIDDTLVIPENITSTRDGTIWFGSVAKGTIYRASRGQAVARPWIPGGPTMLASMGLFADEMRGLLWVCVPGERGKPAAPTAIKTFDLETGAAMASYAFENGGRCNDLTIATDGTVYAGDFDGGRVMRLKAGETIFRSWAADPRLKSVDGIAVLPNGKLYVDTYKTGRLFRLPILKNGGAGALVEVAVDRALGAPDGMRAVGPTKLLLAEGEGRLTELTIHGDVARARTLKDHLGDSPASVTLVGGVAYVVQAQWSAMEKPQLAKPFGALAVPYRR